MAGACLRVRKKAFQLVLRNGYVLGLPLGLFHPSGSCWIFMLHIR